MTLPLHVESAVRDRYRAAAQNRVEALCCPVDYDRQYLRVIPDEIIERDYGCGDPSRYLRPGETVLDLGSGAGKICFIAAQVVGASGRVIGVDMNDEMLALARKHQGTVGNALGYHNVEFRKGRIQDLALDLDRLDAAFRAQPIHGVDGFLAAEARAEELRATQPLIATGSMDVVVSNCVLNLVDSRAKQQLFREIFRVLKNGGRAVISDIVSDGAVPESMQSDPELWSGCISGALTGEQFLHAFVNAGFHGVQLLRRDSTPWRTVQGIDFRSVTVEAFKAPLDPGLERKRTVIYKGPFQEVADDLGHRFQRGQPCPVSDLTWQRLGHAPYSSYFELIELGEVQPSNGTRARGGAPQVSLDPRAIQLNAPKSNGSGGSRCCEGGT